MILKFQTAILLSLLLSVFNTFSQTPFQVNNKGEVMDKNFQTFLGKRNYQFISAFDTVSKKPLLIYALYMKDYKFGILDIRGKEITQAVYTEIDGLNKSYPRFSKGFYSKYTVRIGNQYGLISNTGKALIPIKYDNLFYEGGDSVFTAEIGNKHYYVDSKGAEINYVSQDYSAQQRKYIPEFDKILDKTKTKYTIRDNRKKTSFAAPNFGFPTIIFRDRVVFKDQNQKFGLFDGKRQRLVIPMEYDDIKLAGASGYFVVRKGDKYGVIDSLGSIKCPIEFVSIDVFSGGALIYKDRKSALYTSRFDRISDFVFDGYTRLGDKYAVLKKDEKYGMLELMSGKVVVDFLYDYISYQDTDLKEPLLIVTNNNKEGIVDLRGKVVCPIQYELILPECLTSSDAMGLHAESFFISNRPNLYFFFKNDGKYGLLDNDFKPLLNNEYDLLLKTARSLVSVKKGEKWGLWDMESKKMLLPMVYDAKIESQGGYLSTYKDGFYGLANFEGEEIFANKEKNPIYTDKIYKGLLKTKLTGNQLVYIDYLNHQVVVPAKQ